MALCRFFLFLTAASASDLGVTGLAVWSSFALAAYIVGLSYVAKSESTWGPLKYWPCLLLFAPVFLAYLVNKGPYKPIGLLFSAALVIWVVRHLSFTFWSAEKNIPRTVTGLLAGIVLVDLLAVAGGSVEIALVFILLFVGTLLFQRFVPAT